MTATDARTSAPPRPVTPVSILAATLDRLERGVDTVDDRWIAAFREACALARGLDPYVERATTPESPALHDLAARTAAYDWSAHPGGSTGLEQEMLSGHVEGQWLKLLVHATRATRVLEIGMFSGYSALAMAEALPVGGRVVACEIDAGVAAFAQQCFDRSPAGDRIDVRVGPALDTLAGLSGPFELVFVDADKAGYGAYLDAVLDRGLLAPHGLICVDNTLLQGQPWLPGDRSANGAAIAAFNERVAADPRVEQVLVPLRDGVTVMRAVPQVRR